MRSSLMLQQVGYKITTVFSRVEKTVPEIWLISTNYLPTTLTKKDLNKTRGNMMNFVIYFLINSKYIVSDKCMLSENKLKAKLLWLGTR